MSVVSNLLKSVKNHLPLVCLSTTKFEKINGAGDVASFQLSTVAYQSSSFRRLPVSRFAYPSIGCANKRHLLFNRIAPVYDSVEFGSASYLETYGCILDWVTGLDFSKEQLLMASTRQNLLSNACFKNIEWVEGDATDLPFPDCYFDAITMGYGLRNVVDRQKAMQEMIRVLKPGSKASVLDFNKSTQPFVASFQEWMIDNVVVPVATAYGLAKEYEYLTGSIREYLTGKELEELALEAGFSTAKHYEISGGLMGNLVATR
ncbi:unnamed protein product [Dovyalis caffra]|uniref:Uncharacterized protein n=1 Tax=Dovyalis caffra TaxID=77055 RepID=A0AAV1RBG7_9ROSI|nr:unnamed protein product [Dovyalis caffra]